MWSAVEGWLKAIDMNWASGLFRIWVVISLLWVAGISASDRTLDKILEVVEANSELGPHRGIWTAEQLALVAAEAESQGDLEAAVMLREIYINFSVGEVLTTENRVRFDRALRSLASSMQFTLVPPAVLGFILFGLWWSISGFRSGKRDR